MLKKYLSFFLFLLITQLAYSQSSDKKTKWDLESCIQHAWENSLSIVNSEIAKENAAISQKIAQHARYPSLNGGSSLFFNFGRTIDPVQNAFVTTTFVSNNWSLNTNMTLFSSGRIKNSLKQSEVNMEAADLDLMQMKNDIALQVGTAYINILFSIENLRNANIQLLLSQEQLERTNKLIELGSRPANERLDIESQIATREQTVVINRNAVDNAYLTLKQLLRLDPDYDITLEIPENIDVFTDPYELDYQTVYNAALGTQKSIKAAEMRVNSAELGVDIANSFKYPTLGVGGSIGTNYSNQAKRLTSVSTSRQTQEVFINEQSVIIGTDVQIPTFENSPYINQLDENISYGFGLNMSIPIYNNYNTKGNIQRAKLNILSNQNVLQQTKDLVRNNVQIALTNARAAKQTLAASEKSVAALQASFDNAQKRYEVGGINTFELNSIQNQLDVAQINLLVSKYDYLFRMKVMDFYMGKPIRLN